jgi:hypothetical protein
LDLAIAALTVFGIATGALWIPGGRAMQVDPIIALRHE